MHPVKEHRLDLNSRRHRTLNYDVPCDVMRVYPAMLHAARAYPGHPQIAYDHMFFLPELGLDVFAPAVHDEPGPLSWYVDIAHITPGRAVWRARDLYLDVVIRREGTVFVEDTDEYLAARREGLLTSWEADYALESAHRLLNGLSAHGTNLEAFLRAQGVVLPERVWPRHASPVGEA